MWVGLTSSPQQTRLSERRWRDWGLLSLACDPCWRAVCKPRLLVSIRCPKCRMVHSAGRRLIPASSWVKCMNIGISCSASSVAGSERLAHCCSPCIRSMVSRAKGGRPLPLSVGCGLIRATRSAQGTTRSIFSRNSRVRVLLRIFLNPSELQALATEATLATV